MIDYEKWDCNRQGVELRVGNNVQATQALFVEFNPDAKYTLKNHDVIKDNKVYVSAYQIFMHSVDEGDAAIKLVGSYQHWRKLCSLKWFREGIREFTFDGVEQWREDMDTRDRTIAKRKLMEAAENGNVQAQKFLFGDVPKKSPKKKEKDTQEDLGFDPVKEFSRIQGG